MLQRILLSLFCVCALPAAAQDLELDQFIDRMVASYGFDRVELEQLLTQAKVKNSILRAMERPSETLPWHEYHPRFINAARINGGVKFWRKNKSVLQRAQREYGVPAALIVAIIGVETQYGRNTGSFRVLDALNTLAFHYPRRAEFFRGELEEFLLLVSEEQFNPLGLKGSYAGAIGIGQFIPSSYRRYGVDFDANGKRELDKVHDAVGSIAHYLQSHGWQSGDPVVRPAELDPARSAEILELGIKPERTLAELQRMGVICEQCGAPSVRAGVFDLETELGPAYWLSFDNFYVITRYNRSRRYAMSVHLLAEAIDAAMK